MPSATPDTAAWIERLTPAFEVSMERVRETITNEPSIQDWLRTASLEAAMGLHQEADLQAAATAYGDMLNGLEQRFPDLLEAVQILTHDCGQVSLHWRPLSPQFSTVFVDFQLPFRPRLFIHLDEPSREAAERGLQRLARDLPRGMPFVGHPNEVTGAFGREGRVVGIRLKEAQRQEGTIVRAVSLFPREGASVSDLTEAEAASHLPTLFTNSAEPD